MTEWLLLGALIFGWIVAGLRMLWVIAFDRGRVRGYGEGYMAAKEHDIELHNVEPVKPRTTPFNFRDGRRATTKPSTKTIRLTSAY